MRRIQELIGQEHEADAINRAMRDFVQAQRAVTVGAVHVTCSDECEREAAESFQHWFAESLLPELKFWSKSPFRSANLGGRYEWGAIRIAEEHYATPESAEGFKVLVVKLNSHVAVLEVGGQPTYGQMDRYATNSACCGALAALLAGTRHPAMDEIRAAFSYDETPRLDMLRDESVVEPAVQSFVAAVVSARLQARSAICDIQDYKPQTPTVMVVLPTVSLNRPQRDTEFVVGMYISDSRKGLGEAQYVGLGDDPSRYQLTTVHGALRISDDHLKQQREARDHRQEVVSQWRARHPEAVMVRDPRLAEIAGQAKDTSGHTSQMMQETLKTLLWLAADVAPVPLSIMLFAKGVAGIHHLYQVHRLARGVDGNAEARRIIEEVSDQVAKLPVEKARDTISAIMEHYQPA